MAKNHRFPQAIATGELPLPAEGLIGVINAHNFAGLAELSDRLVCEQGFRPEYDRLVAGGLDTSPMITGQFASVLVVLGKHRNLNRANIARAMRMLERGGILTLDGQKTDGIDSLLREIRKFLPIDGTISRAHGKLAWTAALDTRPGAPASWAEAGDRGLNDDGFFAAPGMFSAARSDPGSLKLSQQFNDGLHGRAADLGAGWGLLSAALLKAAPKITALDLYEADHASLEAARENVADPRAGFHWSDVARLQGDTPPYDIIVSNPPFHQGRASDPDLGIAFIAAAARILKPSGTAFFVANRQLPYEQAFETHFKDWRVIAEDGSFKVIRARRPRGLVAKSRYRSRK